MATAGGDRALRRKWAAHLDRNGLSERLNLEQVAAMANVAAAQLADASKPDRASRAAARVADFIEVSTAKNSQMSRIACKAGCNYCCRQYVSGTAPELFFLARTVRTSAIAGELRSKIGVSATRDAARADRNIDLFTDECALLEDGVCSVYAGRPMSCRGYNSENVDACIAWKDDRSMSVPLNLVQINIGNQGKMALWAALKAIGLSNASYGVHEALERILMTPDAEARWLAGEHVFEGIAKDPSRPANVASVIDRIIATMEKGAPPP